MPSTEPIPEITDLVNAYKGGVASVRQYVDRHDGSMHDILAGQGAILWRRIAENDRDNFRRIYFDTAPREALDEIIERKYQLERVEDQLGAGTMDLSRPNTSGGGGTFFAGTRIRLNLGGGDPVRYYTVTADTPVPGTATTATAVPVQALAFEEKAFDLIRGNVLVLDVDDPIWDESWQVDRLTVAAGVIGETNDQYRARAHAKRLADRVGYITAIQAELEAAGAATLAFFQSDFLGDALDDGLNRVYVADAGYETSAALLKACRLALPRVATAGASVQALSMTRTNLTVQATVTMFAEPERFDRAAITRRSVGAVIEYFRTRENPFIWRKAGVRGAIFRSVPNVQSIDLDTSSDEPDLATLFASDPLPRYSVADWGVSVSIVGPS